MKNTLSPATHYSAISAVSEIGLRVDGAGVAAYIHSKLLLVDQLSNDPHSHLRRDPLFSDVAEHESWVETFFPDGLLRDADEPVFGDGSYEQIPAGRGTLFLKGINGLSNLLSRGIE
jgi:hypothetical protein